MTAWRTRRPPGRDHPQITVHELKTRLDRGEIDLLDVRQPDEWHRGHIPGALWITGAELPDRTDEVPRERPLVVTCGSGNAPRSGPACSPVTATPTS